MKKFLSAILILAMSMSISGCFMGADTVAKVNGDAVSKEMYQYYLTATKNNLSSENATGMTDFWTNGTIEGENAGVYAKNLAMDNIARIYVIRQQAIKNGLKLTADDEKEVADSKASTIQQLGGQAAYEEALKPYGISDATYTEILRNSKYEQKLYDDVKAKYTTEELKKFYETEMFRIKHVLISTTDSTTGLTLSEDKIATAKATAEDIERRAKAGEDFDMLVETYSEDPGSVSNPDGYLMTKNSNMVKPFLDAAIALAVDEVSGIVETSYGYHILKKYAVQPEKFDADTTIASEVRNEMWQKSVADWQNSAKISHNKKVWDSITVE